MKVAAEIEKRDGAVRGAVTSSECKLPEEVVDVILSMAGSRIESSQILVEFLIAKLSQDPALNAEVDASLNRIEAVLGKPFKFVRIRDQLDVELERVDSATATAPPSSALFGFGRIWGIARGRKPAEVADARKKSIAESCASNDLTTLGRLLMAEDVNALVIADLPDSLLRCPAACPVLDVAFGCASLDVSKYLLEFHGATPTRETLKMAISSGNLELIRLAWERLPEEHETRFDLLEVAADFHREEPFVWLFRDATGLEREAFLEIALERRLADAVVLAVATGSRPWSTRSRDVAVAWRAAISLEFGTPPEGSRRTAAGS
jgi:hypothetical protein